MLIPRMGRDYLYRLRFNPALPFSEADEINGRQKGGRDQKGDGDSGKGGDHVRPLGKAKLADDPVRKCGP